LRTLLAAALLHCTDHLLAPADLVLTATAEAGGALLRVEVRSSSEGDNSFRGEANYRPLEWHDLEALAAADGVELARQDQGIALRLPWAP
jgi:hypothetical protein